MLVICFIAGVLFLARADMSALVTAFRPAVGLTKPLPNGYREIHMDKYNIPLLLSSLRETQTKNTDKTQH
jgi:hypothetical protein